MLPFVIDRKTTYEESAPKDRRKDHKAWVSQPSGGLEKRQYTLQVCFSPVAALQSYSVEQGSVFLLTKKQPTTKG